MNPHGPPILEARDLWVTPPGAAEPVVRDLSLDVGRGEWLALAGPNGSGKTSVILALAGLWPASRGHVRFDGEPLRTASGSRDPGIGVVLQDPSAQLLAPTVGDELAFTARSLGIPETEIDAAAQEWVEAFDLARDLDRDPRMLSAGRQQVVLLGAALIARPRLLLADEPAAHLDAASRELVLERVAERVNAGLSVVWASQDREELAAAGRTIQLGGRDTRSDPPPPPGPSAPGQAVLRIRVAALELGDGPRVITDRAIEIVVEQPGVTALVGANGVGKSVILAAASGLERCDQIEIQWLQPPTGSPIVALQYPELQIFEELVADELVFASVSRGVGRLAAFGAAKHALRMLALDAESMMQRRTWSLSTGEKRLIEVVGALIAPSCLILLDEPTAGLDDRRRFLLGEMVRRRAEEIPVVVASQDRTWLTHFGARETVLGAEGRSSAKSQPKKRLTATCQGP